MISSGRMCSVTSCLIPSFGIRASTQLSKNPLQKLLCSKDRTGIASSSTFPSIRQTPHGRSPLPQNSRMMSVLRQTGPRMGKTCIYQQRIVSLGTHNYRLPRQPACCVGGTRYRATRGQRNPSVNNRLDEHYRQLCTTLTRCLISDHLRSYQIFCDSLSWLMLGGGGQQARPSLFLEPTR